MKKIYSIILLTGLLMGDPTESSTRNAYPESNSSKKLVEETEMTKGDYNRGDSYNINIERISNVPDSEVLPQRTVNLNIDTTGSREYLDENNNSTTAIYKDTKNSSIYQSKYNDLMYKVDSDGEFHYIGGIDATSRKRVLFNKLKKEGLSNSDIYIDSRYISLESQINSEKAAKEVKLNTAKAEKMKEMDRKSHTQKSYETSFIKGLNSASQGPGIANKLVSPAENPVKFRNGTTSEDTNITNFYSQNYGSKPYNNSRVKVEQSNANKLIEAYQQVDKIEAVAKSGMDSTSIRCFLSRDLIPAFYCPMEDRDEVLFPDFTEGNVTTAEAKLLSSDEAKKECDDSCKKPQACQGLDLGLSIDKSFASLSGKKLYPTIEQSSGTYELLVNNKQQVRNIAFTVKITPSSTFTGDAAAFDIFLEEHTPRLKIRYSLFNRPVSTAVLPEQIVNKSALGVYKGELSVAIPLERQTDRLVLKFYKPFLYQDNVPSYRRVSETSFFGKIESISIDSIKVNYQGSKLYFCPVRQIVSDSRGCSSDILHISNGGQLYDICTDDYHAIGEDIITGGFFTENGCIQSCYATKNCKPTYSHYTTISNSQIFKSTIGCVEENSNIGCAPSYCERLFNDSEIIPVEEMVIQNDDTKVYTVRNFLTTDVPRPKIDIVGEGIASTTEELNNVFEKEMKDAAYQNMIDEQTFTRLKYKVGEVSPEQSAGLVSRVSSGLTIKGKLKPQSDKFDNGISYNIYGVVKLEQSFKAKYGQYTVPDENGVMRVVNAQNTPIIIRDDAYFINNNGVWQLFRRISNSKIKHITKFILCPGTAAPVAVNPAHPQLTQAQKDAGCYLQEKIEWADMSSFSQDKFVRYNSGTKDLAEFAGSEIAKYIVKEPFVADKEIKEYDLITNMERTLNTLNGAYIRSQITENNGVSFKRVFDMTTDYIPVERSIMTNVKIFLFSSQDNLSYQNIIDYKLTAETRIHDNINRTQSRTKIDDDGEIDNNIKPFLMGNPDRTTLSVSIAPKFDEEGKRIFKFIFLFDE